MRLSRDALIHSCKLIGGLNPHSNFFCPSLENFLAAPMNTHTFLHQLRTLKWTYHLCADGSIYFDGKSRRIFVEIAAGTR